MTTPNQRWRRENPLRDADEFPAGASEWPAELNRRRFIELMGASLALAGLGGCNRPPQKTIVPYVVPPERELADASVYYATAMPWEGFGRGLLALSRSGRPTKLEGNPEHPDSLGATDILMQAAVLSLYDPDRSQAPRRTSETTPPRSEIVAWEQFENEWLTIHAELARRRGKGLALLTEPTTSPTLLRGIHALLDRFPDARWFQHTALPRYDDNGEQPDYDFAKTNVVLAIDADFLFAHPSALRYARDFASRRRIQNGKVHANRLYAIEPAPSITGSMADHHLAAAPTRTRLLLRAIEAALNGRPAAENLTEFERDFSHACAADLKLHAPNVLCLAGAHVEADIHAWVRRINAQLAADGVTRQALPAVRSDADSRSAGDLAALVRAIEDHAIDTLVTMGGNPAYTAPADVNFGSALKQVRRTIHFGPYGDETARGCEWHIPESHFLECWSDVRAFDGTASIVQPLISPLYASRSAVAFLFFLGDPAAQSDYDLVRATWQTHDAIAGDFEASWQKWLNRGVIEGTTNGRTKPVQPPASPELNSPESSPAPMLIVRPDPTIRDGAWTNHAWLQELPKFPTQVVWDNPALVSPAFARQHSLADGDVLRLQTKDSRIEVPVCITPRVAPDCIVVYLGYGRSCAGRVGSGLGFDAYALRTAESPWATALVGLARTDRRETLVSTHAHFSMEGREIVKVVPAADAGRAAHRSSENPPSLFPEWKYDGYRWGMSIDLGTCIGCLACVIACQAENNTPVVGKDQVARGREMHWLRVDRYYVGDPDHPDLVHQPVLCMQCEHAPCELVCPVAATVHSSEGLNDMVYNRCIGTRYCSNNCPYKVRRFNFLDYREPANSPVYLQKNPDVTVRARGVMEKCTYCVQRINAARIAAEREDRRVHDGEVRTACQQACPTEAIVFGDLNDPASRVGARKAEPTDYTLLEELNTVPRTTYLAKITNRNDAAGLIGDRASTGTAWSGDPALQQGRHSENVGRGLPTTPSETITKTNVGPGIRSTHV